MLTKREWIRKHAKRVRNTVVYRTPNTAPVFIFGEMRSGTNMLAECLDRCPSTDVFHETDPEAFTDYVLKDDDHLRRLIRRSPGTHAVFKCIADSARALDLLQSFPGAKGLWIYRQFADVVNSALQKWKDHNRYLHDILHDPARANWRRTSLAPRHIELIKEHYERKISEASARALIWYIRNDLFFHQQLEENADVRLIRYERLVADAETIMSPAFDFLGLRFDSAYVKHITPTSVNKHPPPAIDPDIQELCIDLLRRLDEQVASQASGSVTSQSEATGG